METQDKFLQALRLAIELDEFQKKQIAMILIDSMLTERSAQRARNMCQIWNDKRRKE